LGFRLNRQRKAYHLQTLQITRTSLWTCICKRPLKNWKRPIKNNNRW